MLETVFSSFTDIYTLLAGKLVIWIRQAILLIPNVITASLVFLVFYLAGKFSESLILRFTRGYTLGSEFVRIIARIIYGAFVIAGVFFALGILHLDKTVTSLLAGAGIIGLALSFAFQDIATNFVSGFIIALHKPIKVGDMVETNGYMGYISEITLRAIHLKTFQGQDVIIPSKDVLQKAIKNYTTLGSRRVEIVVRVAYKEDLERVTEIARKAVEQVTERDEVFPVDVYFEELGESSANMRVMFWINLIQNRNFLKARHEAILLLHKAFRNHDVTIPYPARILHFSEKERSAEDKPRTF